jgi:c-di-GMP-related signal transduction protein
MAESPLLARQALLDTQLRPLSWQLQWQGAEPASALGMLELVAEHAAGLPCLLRVSPSQIGPVPQEKLAPASVTLLVDAASCDGALLASMDAWRAAGAGVGLPVATIVANPALLARSSHVELDARQQLERQVQALSGRGAQLLAGHVSEWDQAAQCTRLKLPVLAGELVKAPAPAGQRGLNAAQTVIVQAMDLVARNADLRELDAVLRRDAALSFRLLRYINSAGFGLGTQVQSLRHAVNLLGYSTLQRWLGLLLATAGGGVHAPALVATAVCRARMAELLGAQLLGRREAEELFMTGMFSMLDRLLGMPMEKVLEQVELPEAVSDALLGRQGVYGPFLQLVEACEDAKAEGAVLAESLFISSQTVNGIHLNALAWARQFAD